MEQTIRKLIEVRKNMAFLALGATIMHTVPQPTSFLVNRQNDQTWRPFLDFMEASAIARGRQFSAEHARAVREMLHWDIPRHVTDAHRLERWIGDNARNTIGRYRIFE